MQWIFTDMKDDRDSCLASGYSHRDQRKIVDMNQIWLMLFDKRLGCTNSCSISEKSTPVRSMPPRETKTGIIAKEINGGCNIYGYFHFLQLVGKRTRSVQNNKRQKILTIRCAQNFQKASAGAIDSCTVLKI
ncbi:MAG: hypothetical protein A2X46_08770 [Lentisphaerae bacterium GWF2_57_35]|nr:MAG: hypothetical protein A2X46_08770 [Lentisphaerae bacterium GWF2_57_35]